MKNEAQLPAGNLVVNTPPPALSNADLVARALETFESLGWDEPMRILVGHFIAADLVMLDNVKTLDAKSRNESKEALIRWIVYRFCGVLPVGVDIHERTLWLIELCQEGEDEKALRLLENGADPDLKLPGLWPARRYAKRNRECLPQTWAWMERQRLSGVASKQRRMKETATARRAI